MKGRGEKAHDLTTRDQEEREYVCMYVYMSE